MRGKDWDTTTIEIPRWSLSLLKRDGFMRRFHYHSQFAENYKQAYLLTEQEQIAYFGFRHYADYHVFRSEKSKFQKK